MKNTPPAERLPLSRREFMLALGGTVLGVAVGSRADAQEDDLAAFIRGTMEEEGAPGFSGAIVRNDQLLWSGAFGWADMNRRTPMSPDTLQNIGSISKTITATAVMQLWEEGRFQLDDDVGEVLPYDVRNPRFPDEPITFRQLLTHRSSIADGPAYGESYACGDPVVPLGEWIQEYLTPGGAYFNPEENFLAWKPGTLDPPTPPRPYSNVAFGLLGVLVEVLSGQSFNGFCRDRILHPLGMRETGWFLAEIDRARHAVPYSLLPEDFEPPEISDMASLLPAADPSPAAPAPGDLFPHCLYSFYNYPDGLLRTNVQELSRFLRAYIGGGMLNGVRILKSETIGLMLSDQHFGRGLCWSFQETPDGEPFWGHGGGDPGISTYMGFRERDKVGVIIFFNFGGSGNGMFRILERMMEEGERLAGPIHRPLSP